MRVSLIGDCGIDDYVDLKQRRPGGCTFNVAAHMKTLAPGNWDLSVLSALGDDPDADLVKASLQKLGTQNLLSTVSGGTPVQSIRLTATGEKVFCGYAPGVIAGFVPNAAQKAVLAASDAIVTVAYAQIKELTDAVTKVARRGLLVVDYMDMRDFGLELSRVGPWLERTDIAYFGLQPEQTALIAGIEAWQRAKAGRLAVVTLGAAGAVVMHAGASARIPAVPVTKVIDTTGAGDAFLAAFLCEYLQQKTPVAAAHSAARHAAGVVERIGSY